MVDIPLELGLGLRLGIGLGLGLGSGLALGLGFGFPSCWVLVLVPWLDAGVRGGVWERGTLIYGSLLLHRLLVLGMFVE